MIICTSERYNFNKLLVTSSGLNKFTESTKGYFYAVEVMEFIIQLESGCFSDIVKLYFPPESKKCATIEGVRLLKLVMLPSSTIVMCKSENFSKEEIRLGVFASANYINLWGQH